MICVKINLLYNNVYESEAGHIREYDDTSGAERIHERHRTGTSYEIAADGSKVEIIKGESYRLLSNKEQVQIQGQLDITIDEDQDTSYSLTSHKQLNKIITIYKSDQGVSTSIYK